MRETSPWEGVKSSGLLAFPQGDPASNARKLLSILKEYNIFVVPVGEIERFCATTGSHGPQWVSEVLQKDLSTDPELQQAREFVGELISFSSLADMESRPRKATSSIRRIAIDTRNLNKKRVVEILDIVYRTAKTIFYAGFGSYFIILAVDALLKRLR